uniref:cytochrome c oxidase subunit type 2-like protein n=1 Tax=Periconia digitata TaxID=1303443 RepID=UPI0023AB3FEC|nr:cytochrome c oxidase subunit type 2-like protein [Periconia digitata]WCA44872.1 cytochrome c oxidase subunit type 2-like protein [Periconia digitata]
MFGKEMYRICPDNAHNLRTSPLMGSNCYMRDCRQNAVAYCNTCSVNVCRIHRNGLNTSSFLPVFAIPLVEFPFISIAIRAIVYCITSLIEISLLPVVMCCLETLLQVRRGLRLFNLCKKINSFIKNNPKLILMLISIISTFVLYSTEVSCDAPRAWGLYFQYSASPQMESLVELHDNIMFHLVAILLAIAWIQGSTQKIKRYKSPISTSPKYSIKELLYYWKNMFVYAVISIILLEVAVCLEVEFLEPINCASRGDFTKDLTTNNETTDSRPDSPESCTSEVTPIERVDSFSDIKFDETCYQLFIRLNNLLRTTHDIRGAICDSQADFSQIVSREVKTLKGLDINFWIQLKGLRKAIGNAYINNVTDLATRDKILEDCSNLARLESVIVDAIFKLVDDNPDIYYKSEIDSIRHCKEGMDKWIADSRAYKRSIYHCEYRLRSMDANKTNWDRPVPASNGVFNKVADTRHHSDAERAAFWEKANRR